MNKNKGHIRRNLWGKNNHNSGLAGSDCDFIGSLFRGMFHGILWAMEKVGVHKRDILVDRGSMEWD
jgi:hypothetical protein